MGSISSVYVGTDYSERNEPNKETIESVDEESAICRLGNNEVQNACQKVVRVEMNHSLRVTDDRSENPESRREHLGITIQYLAEENVRLVMINKQLQSDIERLNRKMEVQATENESPDHIYGESTEQRLCRLEKHLASERQEKWSAIENSERTRVDLVNCEKELTKSNEIVGKLTKELEEKETLINDLKMSVSELKEKNTHDAENSRAQSEREASMSEFRADLKAKREARQRALSGISQEMNNLREELRIEKSKRRKIEQELEFTKENATDSSVKEILSDNATLKNEINILTENIEKLKDFSAENIRLKCEIERRNQEMDSMNLSLGELKFEYYEEKRKHERTLQRLKEMEERENLNSREDWEREKEQLFERYDKEKQEINKRTNALKEVVAITKQMLAIRESEVEELKRKLKDIEESVKNTGILQEDGLKAEYEKQLENIKNLRELYEERVRLLEKEREKLHESLEEKSNKINDQQKEIETLSTELESSKQETKSEKSDKESMDRELRLTIAKTKDLENEINLTNNLFTQMLLGPYNSGNETDLDKLTELLQENHDLIVEMTTREDSSEIASVLPKLLLDLITQVDGINGRKDDDILESCNTVSEQSEGLLDENKEAVLPILSYKDARLFKPLPAEKDIKIDETRPFEGAKIPEQISPAVQEIASNLPKVWRVLMELLSHHSAPEEPTPGDEKQCYKNVDTPNGPRTVISVSKTFIRLKDLILEKKALQKELTRLKQLNTHLETRLDDQEKRLSQVQCELHKTWGIVGRMRAQHQQLHNNEKILRFELQEKRVMLSELKQELEYCRDKWERARQKNDESETEWKKLRREFAARKSKDYLLSSLNDSGESGFSDEQNESGEDCENFDTDRSSTQSPVDSKLLEVAVDNKSNSPEQIDLAVEIIKQSENNLKQTSQNVEQVSLEECSEVQPTTSKTKTQEDERTRAREARDLRLKRLEEQCKLLVRQVDITTHKSNYLNNRLEELHEQYGSTEDGRRHAGTSQETKGSSQAQTVDAATSSKVQEGGTSSQTHHEHTDCDAATSSQTQVVVAASSSLVQEDAALGQTNHEQADCDGEEELEKTCQDENNK